MTADRTFMVSEIQAGSLAEGAVIWMGADTWDGPRWQSVEFVNRLSTGIGIGTTDGTLFELQPDEVVLVRCNG